MPWFIWVDFNDRDMYGGDIHDVRAAAAAAQPLWSELVNIVDDCGRLTYAYGSHQTGYPLRLMGDPCWLIMVHCRKNGLPPLNVLVVRSEPPYMPGDGMPGQYYANMRDPYGILMRSVWAYRNWAGLRPPRLRDFEEAAEWFERNKPIGPETKPAMPAKFLDDVRRAPDPTIGKSGRILHYVDAKGIVELDPRVR